MSSPPKKRGWIWLLAGLVIGVVGLAGTSYVAEATDQRTFCSSCHLMEPQALTHKLSSHMNENCNECHLPNGSFVSHYAQKAFIGVNDIVCNTFGWYEYPVVATSSMKDTINENCKRCHVSVNLNVNSMNVKPYCTDCHRNVPHMNAKPISTRMVAYE